MGLKTGSLQQCTVHNGKNTEKRKLYVMHSIRKADLILISACLFFAVFLGIFFAARRGTGSKMTLSRDGAEIYSLDLNKTGNGQMQYYLIWCRDQETHIMHFEEYPELSELPEGESYNLLSVENGKVSMEAADCRDQICVRHIPISSHRESIICLPHKLVVELTGTADEAVKSGSDRQDQRKDYEQDTNREESGPEEEFEELLDGVAG